MLQSFEERDVERLDGLEPCRAKMPVDLQRLELALQHGRVDEPERGQPVAAKHRQGDVVLAAEGIVEREGDIVWAERAGFDAVQEDRRRKNSLGAHVLDQPRELVGGKGALTDRVRGSTGIVEVME